MGGASSKTLVVTLPPEKVKRGSSRAGRPTTGSERPKTGSERPKTGAKASKAGGKAGGKAAAKEEAATSQGSFKNAKGAWGYSGSSDSLKLHDDPLGRPTKHALHDMEMEDLDADDQVLINWKQLADKIPAETNTEEKERRRQLFEAWDANGNGFLSLAELDKGIRQTGGLETLHRCKPAMTRAYAAAKFVKRGRYGGRYDEFVSRHEFRVLCVYLKLYFELNHIFSALEAGHDSRITLQQFRAHADSLRAWGAPVDSNPEITFKKVDSTCQGSFSFEEFAEYAIDNNTKYQESQDDDSE